MAEPLRAPLTGAERTGLGVAIAAHVALIAAFALGEPGKDRVVPPERMTVTLAEEVAPSSTAPDPAPAAADVAPTLGEPQPQPEAAPEPAPDPVVTPQPPIAPAPSPRPTVAPKPVAKPSPKPVPKPTPKPVAKPVPKPITKPAPSPAASPAAKAAPKAAPKAVPKPAASPAAKAAPKAGAGDERNRRRPDAPSGASKIGADFLKGVQGAPPAREVARGTPAAAIGPQVAASLSGSIARQLKPHWTAPQGVDAEKLVTILAWDLNPDGSLDGRPRMVSQQGITDANRAQAARHAEQAIRAVQLAAPFKLPDEYYSGWKRVSQFRFDRKLSQ